MSFPVKLTALCLSMTLPLWVILAFKWPISSDFIFYATSAKAFSAQFWAGEMYPRWLEDTNSTFGSPVFLFYSPLGFYVTSFFEFLRPLDSHGFGCVLISIMIAILTAGITSYRWLKQDLPDDAAQKGALLYAGFPYLLLHIYGGFAVAQLWGIALFPLLMEAAGDMAQAGWKAVPKLSLAYALLCFAHLPSVVLFAGVPWLYVAVFAPRRRKVLYTLLATFSMVLGIALVMFYLLPVARNKVFIATEHFLDDNLVYYHNFLDTWSLLGIVVMVLPLCGLYFELPRSYRRSGINKQVRFWMVIEAAFLFMTLPLSRPLWDALTPLQHLQFPFRFFLAMLPGVVFLAVRWLPQAKSNTIYNVLFVAGLTCATVYCEEIMFYSSSKPAAAVLNSNLLARPEYQTRWMQAHEIDFRLSVPEEFSQMQPTEVIDGKGTVSVIAQDARHIMLRADIMSPQASVALRRFYFPGWVVENPADVTIAEHNSLLTLHIPQGDHTITLDIPWFIGEREGTIISLGGLIIWLAFFAFSYLHAMDNRRITGQNLLQH